MRREKVGRGLLVLAALINLLPGLGAVSVSFARSAYGVEIVGADMEVLLRHRAMLFAILGVGLFAAVFRPRLRTAAVSSNAASFGGFILLAVTNRPVNAALERIAWIDVAGLVALALGAVLLRGGPERPHC
nr:phosphopantetheine adenylyltransferase [Kibdelosporangium sp. MJ126-NF4]